MCQQHYVNDLKEISMTRDRHRDKHSPTSDCEKGLLRALYGVLSWHVGQVGLKYPAHVSLGLSEISTSTVEDLEVANKLLCKVKQDSKTPV